MTRKGHCVSSTSSARGVVGRRLTGLLIGMLGAAAAQARPPAQAPGDEVASMTMTAPTQSSFILHGTLPVPRGTWDGDSGGSPVEVLDWTGAPARTQAAVVSRYPGEADGADVIEVLAKVERPPGVKSGDPVSYDVVLRNQPEAPIVLHPAVEDLLSTQGALRLETFDVFGHRYMTNLLDGPVYERRRDGSLVRERARHRILLPVVEVQGSQGTLPHAMGAHAWVREIHEEGYLLVDLHVHNGMNGLDPVVRSDDALERLYFERLSLILPAGWKVVHAFDHDALGPVQPMGAHERHQLLAAQDGTCYVMHPQAQFVRRLAITLPGWENRARAALESRYLAFCEAGRSPSTGEELWSWWNPDTARYYPQRQRMPELDHGNLNHLSSELRNRMKAVEEQIRRGTKGVFPFLSERLGWAHPWGVGYGGMTGGVEIHMYDGLRTAATASRAGYRLAQARMRAYADRQPTALYSLDGRPTTVEDILVHGPNGRYAIATFYLRPQLGDPFGFQDAPTFQSQAAQALGKRPRWEDELSTFEPIDLQHYIRYTRNLKVLTWLGNDSLARHELRAAVELFRLSFHEYPYLAAGHVQGTGLLAKILHAEEYPGEGLEIGRGEAWGLDAAAAAYSTGDHAYRQRIYPWIESVVRTFDRGQSSCTQNLMALYVGKAFGGRYLVRNSNECAFLEHAIMGLRESLFADHDPALSTLAAKVLLGSVRSGFGAPYWNEQAQASWWTVAVSQREEGSDPFCLDPPPWGYESEIDRLHQWSPLAYAFQLTDNPWYLERAQALAGGDSLWDHLHRQDLYWLGLEAALLSLVQERAD